MFKDQVLTADNDKVTTNNTRPWDVLDKGLDASTEFQFGLTLHSAYEIFPGESELPVDMVLFCHLISRERTNLFRELDSDTNEFVGQHSSIEIREMFDRFSDHLDGNPMRARNLILRITGEEGLQGFSGPELPHIFRLARTLRDCGFTASEINFLIEDVAEGEFAPTIQQIMKLVSDTQFLFPADEDEENALWNRRIVLGLWEEGLESRYLGLLTMMTVYQRKIRRHELKRFDRGLLKSSERKELANDREAFRVLFMQICERFILNEEFPEGMEVKF